MPDARRTAIVTAALAATGGVAGAVCGLATLLPVIVLRWWRPALVDAALSPADLAPMCAAIGAIVGAVVAPILGLGLLRAAPLWRVLLQPSIGALIGSMAGCVWMLIGHAPLGVDTPLAAGALGAMVSSAVLRSHYRQHTAAHG